MEDIFLRYAVQEDAEFLFKLINDRECRRSSLNSGKINWNEHMDWFRKILLSGTQKQYILMDRETPVGQGRVEASGETCRISYSIISERRGCGYGKILVGLLNNAAVKDFRGCNSCFGEVLRENIASQKMFEELGFASEEQEKYFRYKKRIEYCEIEQEISKKNGGVLLLSNNNNSYILYQWLKDQGERTYFYSGRLTEAQILFLSPKLVISYNYSYLIPKSIIRLVKGKIVNLHISYLPWNKGSDPNFWSFIDDTPKGVTIHQLSEGLDQGDILLQKELFFNEKEETFHSTYELLNREIVAMFTEHFQEIKSQTLIPYTQQGEGSYHKRKELIDFMDGKAIDWDEIIYDFKQRKLYRKGL